MRRSLFSAVVLCLVAAAVPAAQAAPDATRRYIVVLDDSVANPSGVAASHAREHGASVAHIYAHALKGYSAVMSETAASRVARDSRVRLVEADRAVHATAAVSSSVPTGVHRSYAAHNPAIDIDDLDDNRVDVDVAIIDSGIATHPALNIVGGKNCSTGSSYEDGNGHGTHVAGTVGGLDDATGAVGMAPGARLWAVRVLDNAGSGSWSTVICGVDWVTGINTNKNADGTLKTSDDIEVANMSLGGSGSEPSDPDFDCVTSSSLHDAICRSVTAGATYAVAAGNEAADAALHVPSAYNEVMTVSALADFNGEPGGGAAATCRSDHDDTFANFSNYGVDVDVIAPGVCIRSTWKGGGYNTISGTSMASPHVAGAAAVYKSSHPAASPGDVQTAIVSSGNLAWTWPSEDKDATQEPLLDVGSDAVKAGLFAPTFVASPPPPENSAPVAVDDSASTTTGSTVTIAVLANDADADGDTLLVTALTQPDAGSAVLTDSDTKVAYTAPSTAGTYFFTYAASDGVATSESGTVTISVSSPTATTMSASATQSTSGGKNANKDLYSTAAVTSGGTAVGGAAVSVVIHNVTSDRKWNLSGTTDSSGKVTWKITNAPSGCYTTTITAVSAPGQTWDGNNSVSLELCK